LEQRCNQGNRKTIREEREQFISRTNSTDAVLQDAQKRWDVYRSCFQVFHQDLQRMWEPIRSHRACRLVGKAMAMFCLWSRARPRCQCGS
jgi:hypothetical protein